MDTIEQVRVLRGIGYGWSYHEARSIQNGIQSPYFWRTFHLMVPVDTNPFWIDWERVPEMSKLRQEWNGVIR